ncbi:MULTISPECIES: 5'-methylthioadenosine/S-adenosylhomocysteine nucleosidase [Micromonospora]|uniref:5'-methylthioadenosine/S-adenosylhomocysteine nucleosidase family protein n=1 Tax=Micromonospora TaxID=1873 RepID=UPI001C235239|nr:MULTISPECIES: 5'-methylthioadenosine/S-adenosylhomocysteine nucleosidase [Micromonospora]MBU8858032.1 5'-methylthioadenosine/S-adenosylhomocysteine nucleosidase [Micromonospora sp. WMMB482]MCT2276395.1 5'-methylthioadenosine/S-adenosylhomocysteine nucleosidase [Micromonospora chalcea]MDM4783666.1 5'-methylthioadenosine/S-adenosylhomocysteine nucleosidase [Micromonospora sp. b486]
MSTNSGFVVILTALDLEYAAVRDQLTDLRVRRHPAGTRFEVGRISQSDCRVALGLVGKGNHPAAVLAERAMAEFSPAAVLFVGVAGGLWPNIRLGDVVVASKIYAYHGGTSEDDGLKARPKAWEIPHEADQIAHHVDRSAAWRRCLPVGAAPKVHFGPIAAGEVVQDSGISEQARWIRQHYNDAVAIEMEAAGVAQAGHLNRALPVVVVRGISDHADGGKAATDGQDWQPKAARHAAAFATALARELIIDGPASRGGADRDGSPTMPMTNRNIATGNAHVGVQAGQIYGNVTVGAGANQRIDLAASIADLRTHLKQAHLDGQLDEETYAAAESELEAATACVSAGTPEKKSGLMVALKRLRGLVADVSELAARLAAIIAVVRDL